MTNLMTALLDELERNIDLRRDYKEIPEGILGGTLINADIQEAKRAISESDTVGMMKVYNALKNNQ